MSNRSGFRRGQIAGYLIVGLLGGIIGGVLGALIIRYAFPPAPGEIAIPGDYPFADRRDPRLRWLHGFLLRLRPGPHRTAFMGPVLRHSELCSACHRMSYNLPQNHYKFLRAEDEFGTWQAGPDSGQTIHGFAPPGPTDRCQDCHEPHGGASGVRRSGIQVFRYSGIQVFRYSGVQVFRCSCSLPACGRRPEYLNT